MENKKIKLGYPLDLLLNRDCKFSDYTNQITADFGNLDNEKINGSILLPSNHNPGPGNIIIRGKPGTAKSTLAMQMAVAAAQTGNDCISFYITLEESPENIHIKTQPFGWDQHCSIFSQLCNLDETCSDEEYRTNLKKAIAQHNNECRFYNDKLNCEKCATCKKIDQNRKLTINPHVFISTLTPRNLFVSETTNYTLFWDRYQQLEKLLIAANSYNKEIEKEIEEDSEKLKGKVIKPKISFVIIDSINVFGDNLLTRSELFRIFELFKKYKIIGVVIVEEDEKFIYHQDNKLHGETIEFIGDMIISMTAEEDQGYSVRYLEITKSRYQHQVYGKHLFKIVESSFSKKFLEIDQTKNLKIEIYKADDHKKNIFEDGSYSTQIKDIQIKFNDKIIPIGHPDLAKIEELFFSIKDGEVSYLNTKDTPSGSKSISRICIKIANPIIAVKIFPSLHYLVYGTNIGDNKLKYDPNILKKAFCDENANHFLSKDYSKKGSILIEGPRETFKTSLARDFLMNGLFRIQKGGKIRKTDDHVIFIRFQDYSPNNINLNAFRISENCKEIIYEKNQNTNQILKIINKVLLMIRINGHQKKRKKNFKGLSNLNKIDLVLIRIQKLILSSEKEILTNNINSLFSELKEEDKDWFKNKLIEIISNENNEDLKNIIKNDSNTKLIEKLIEFEGVVLKDILCKLIDNLLSTFYIKNRFNEFINNENGETNPFWNLDLNSSIWNGFARYKNEPTPKKILNSYTCETQHGNKYFTELIFQSGYLFAEEFMHLFLETLFDDELHILIDTKNRRQNRQIRIVLDEVGRIGSSFPLLNNSKTAGDLFLNALFHIIRNYNINLLITGTTGEYAKSDEIINKVKTLVDDVLTTKKINVFGDNYVTIEGGTLTSSETPTQENEYTDENVPGVIIPTGIYTFKIDREKFVGLVGFGTDKIYRPGLELYLFEENHYIHNAYNEGIRRMLRIAYSSMQSKSFLKNNHLPEEIGITGFNGGESPSCHDALDIVSGSPLDKTILYNIDEFYRKKVKEIEKSFLGFNSEKILDLKVDNSLLFKETSLGSKRNNKYYYFPYYSNVMFLVINRSVLKEGNKIFLNDKNERIKITWQEVLKLSTEIKEIGKEKLCKVDLCLLTKETLSCIFLDALISATGIEKEQTKSIGSVLDKFKGKEKELIIELTALSQLLNSSERVKDEIMKQHNNGSNGLYYKDSNGYLIKKNQLVTDSAIYICWYSEIRELLFRKPDLSNQLEVFPLPGGGFKGDWHIGVLNGSVSANLGLNVIKKLCNKNEDYKRFALGVGLPTREEFYKKEKEKEEKIFYAWPYSNVELSEIKEIYDSANERADIDGYLEIKDQLVSMIHWLIQIENDNTGNCEEKIVKDIINRLKPIYDILKPE